MFLPSSFICRFTLVFKIKKVADRDLLRKFAMLRTSKTDTTNANVASKKYVILVEHGRTAPKIMNRPDSERLSLWVPHDQTVTENYNNYKYIIIIIVVLERHALT